jgi:hypothetical protein
MEKIIKLKNKKRNGEREKTNKVMRHTVRTHTGFQPNKELPERVGIHSYMRVDCI